MIGMLSQVRKAYEGLRKARLDEFMAGFNIISLKLKEMYQVGGGVGCVSSRERPAAVFVTEATQLLQTC
jgi:structural maintenance of chromosome 4